MENRHFEPIPPVQSTSDLACERKRADVTLPGVTEKETSLTYTHLSEIRITSKEGAESIGKPEGTYMTISHGPAWSLWGESKEELCDAVESSLRQLSDGFLKGKSKTALTVLVAGLGNRRLTADAIGPRTADAVNATHHLRTQAADVFAGMECAGICVLSPGVLAQTGLEAAALVCEVAHRIKPDLVLAIDALAARSTERLATTIQLCDTGVEPGGGIGNRRMPITRESTGAPVIAIGVPTVVHSTTLISDALANASAEPLHESVVSQMQQDGFFVSPKDIDQTTDILAAIIAQAINRLWGVAQ